MDEHPKLQSKRCKTKEILPTNVVCQIERRKLSGVFMIYYIIIIAFFITLLSNMHIKFESALGSGISWLYS